MVRNRIIVAATVVFLTACSDDLEPDLAACKGKAMDVSEEKRAAYIRECMIPEGLAHKRCLPRQTPYVGFCPMYLR
jgi:hypothetical protein